MALTLSQIQAATNDFYRKGVVTDIYFTQNVLLWKLMGKGGMEMNLVKADDLVDGGEKIREFLEYARSNTGSYGNDTTIPVGKVDIVNAARFRWGGYYASNTIDLAERRANSGKAAMVKLIKTKIQNIQKTIRDNMGSEIYGSAADDDCFLGLGNLTNASTATAYGEIAEDDMAQWKANLITTTEVISYKVMQKIWRAPGIGVSNADKPDLAITTEIMKDGFERTLQTQQRFTDKDLLKVGFENILFKGAPVVADDNQTAGYMDAINSRYLKIKTHEDFNFTVPVWEAERQTPDTLSANTRWSGQLVCSNRKAHVRHTGLTDPT